ncbi:protein FAM210B, mitochondrial [Trichonephila clavipes]|uniref:Protein FAM210B, mitochondrial n=1 Tax=Trichonephila clavipes TaxID=2585209 RepID=A0A8X6SKL6_TRICX|nr:protein FAM210B, mitochondrial [Trichonephila clavipes]
MHKNGLPFYPISSSHLKNSYRLYSSDSKKDSNPDYVQKVESTQDFKTAKVNQRSRLKQAIRDYGATIVVFHVAISLASLGICYVAISNGVDAVRVLSFLGFSDSLISSKVAVGGSTFVMAYAVHKLFAPVRIGITLSVAPFIVRYLRRINWLKPPKMGDRLTNTYTKDFCVRITNTFKKYFLCLDNEHIFGDDQGDTSEIVDEILTTARDLELEVNEDDIEELIMGHKEERTIEELQEILNEEHQETQRNVSPEQEEDERGPMPTSAIKDLLKKWEAVRAMVLEWHPWLMSVGLGIFTTTMLLITSGKS